MSQFLYRVRTAMEFTDKKQIEEKLGKLESFAKRVFNAVDAAKTSLKEWIQVEDRVHRLSVMLKTLRGFITSPSKQSLYLRPCDRILEAVERTLNHAIAMASKSHSKGIISKLFVPIKASYIQTLSRDLTDSIFDMKWLLTVYNHIDDRSFSRNIVFLPIVNSNPILLQIWHCIARVKMGRRLSDRIDAVTTLASLSQDNDTYKKYFVEEQGVPVLLSLLKESADLHAQIAAADALCILTNEPDIVKNIVLVIVRLLKDAPIDVQIQAAELVASMAESDMIPEFDFPKENVILPLVTLLSCEDDTDEINKRKHQLRIACADALWMLARSKVSFCKIIAKNKAMLCLAEMVEKERGGLQYYCLMILMEITAAAESDLNFRCVAFKTNSPSAKAVVEQLVRVIKESQDPNLQIPAIKSIGSLARIFPAPQTSVIGSLALLLYNKHLTVATEAAIALSKFIHKENFHHEQHLKSIDEFSAVPALLRLLEDGSKVNMHRSKVDLPTDIFDAWEDENDLVIRWGMDGIRTQYRLSNNSIHHLKDMEHHSQPIYVQ